MRKFEDDESSHVPEETDLQNELLLNQAEGHARRPLTRSSITPRLLFQDEINAQRETTPLVDEEEALTDIEYPLPTPSRKGRKTIDVGLFSKPQEEEEEEPATSPTEAPKRRKTTIHSATTVPNVPIDMFSEITLHSFTRVVKSSTRTTCCHFRECGSLQVRVAV